MPPTTSQKWVQIFLGHAGYYRGFIDNFIKITFPLYKLLAKEVGFYWSKECQHAFDVLKETISLALVLIGLNWSLLLHSSTDALDSTIEVVLRKKKNFLTHAIYILNKKLSPAELNYTVTEKEFLTMVYEINKYRHYITWYEVFIHTFHSTIMYLMNKAITNGRIMRWLLLL
jgi:hypothetical protein